MKPRLRALPFMVASLLLLLLLPLPATFALQEGTPDPVAPEGLEPCTLTARIVDADGHPVSGARLGVDSRTRGVSERTPEGLAESGKDGRVEMELAPDLYRWAVASQLHPTSGERTLDLRQGCGAARLGEVALGENVVLRGRVVDPAGEPVAAAEVLVHDPEATPSYLRSDGGPRSLPHRRAVTDATGDFELPGLEAGVAYRVTARRQGYRFTSRQVVPPERSEGTEEPSPPAETPFDEPPTAETLTLVLDPAARLEVQVSDPDGQPLEGAEVEARPLGRGRSFGARARHATDAEGRVVLRALEPGTHRLMVRAAGYASGDRELELEAGSSRTERFVLEPVPGAPVEVSVVDEEGVPVPGALVVLRSLRPPSAAETGLGSGRRPPFTHVHERTGDDGRVEWERLPLQSYELTVQPPPERSFESLEPVRLEVPPSGLEHRLVLRRPPGRAVVGRVVDADGAGVPGVTLRIYARAKLEAVSGADGRFRFERVPYGRHHVRLDAPGVVGLPPRELEVAEVAEPTREPWLVRLDPGVEVFGELQLPRGLSLDDLDRAGGEGWQLTARHPGLGGTARGWMEGPLAFRFPPLSPGSWLLTARRGRLEGTVRVELGGGRSRDPVRRDIPLDPPAEAFPVTGVLTHRGEPLASADVRLDPVEAFEDAQMAETGTDGRFAWEAVPEGEYQFLVWWDGAVVYNRVVEVEGPTDLSRELRFARVRGRVELEALEGVDPRELLVRLQPRGPEGDPSRWLYMTHTYQEFVHPGSDGTFEVGPLEEGRWDFLLNVPGYVPIQRRVVIAEQDVEDLVLSPEPAEGLVLRVIEGQGGVPESFTATYRPADGVSGRAGTERTELFSPRGPIVHWRGVPEGAGAVRVETRFSRSGWEPVRVPAPAVHIRLPPRGHLVVWARHLTPEERQAAVVRYRVVEGRAPRRGEGTAELFPSGGVRMPLWPATYEVTVELPDGRSWSEVVEVEDHVEVEWVVE